MVLRHREPYRVFYDMLGFCPNDIELFKQACRHRSVRRDARQKNDNERLEFLGDAVLGVVVSDILFNKYDDKNEGFLSKTRSKIVQRETLNQVAVKLGLDKIVEVTVQSQSHNNNTYGNALEALVGAIYLDQGFEECCKIVEERIIRKYIDIDKLSQQEVNFKSRLIEWCQHHRIDYRFDIDDISSDEFKNPIFHARIFVAEQCLGQGRGYTKKEAQQVASQEALRYIHKHKNCLQTFRKKTSEEDVTAQ